MKDGYILQTLNSNKYVSLRETELGSGILKQVIASRREYVVWRLLDPKDLAIVSKSNSTRDSCNVLFDEDAEEEVKVNTIHTVLIPSISPKFGIQSSQGRPSANFGSFIDSHNLGSISADPNHRDNLDGYGKQKMADVELIHMGSSATAANQDEDQVDIDELMRDKQ